MTVRKPMGMFEAVFNRHVNNAGKRAVAVMKRECPSHLARVREVEKKEGGIMAIFAMPEEPALVRYAQLVQKFVNGEGTTR